MDLIKNERVVFEPVAHSYTNEEGKKLSGVTSLMKKYLFPNLYSAVDPVILEKARERGTAIHANIQLLIDGVLEAGTEPTIKCFEDACKDIHFVASEYLVSDNDSIASSIDLVDDNNNLYDIKTTSVINLDYVRWQLSIYKFLFVAQNPNAKVGGLYVIHMHEGVCKVVPVEPIPMVCVCDLIEANRDGADPDSYINPLYRVDATTDGLLKQYADLMERRLDITAVAKQIDEQIDAIKLIILGGMTEKGQRKLETEQAVVTYKAPSHRQTWSMTKFEEMHPDFAKENKAILADGYKASEVKESITIKFK